MRHFGQGGVGCVVSGGGRGKYKRWESSRILKKKLLFYFDRLHLLTSASEFLKLSKSEDYTYFFFYSVYLIALKYPIVFNTFFSKSLFFFFLLIRRTTLGKHLSIYLNFAPLPFSISVGFLSTFHFRSSPSTLSPASIHPLSPANNLLC